MNRLYAHKIARQIDERVSFDSILSKKPQVLGNMLFTHLEGPSFWITAESPNKMWIQVVRHNSP